MRTTSTQTAKLDPEAEMLVRHYGELVIGNKRVIAPYFMNKKGRKGRRVAVGKGTPEALERETTRLARKYDFDLNKASPEEIRAFMVDHCLGIDCSGLVSWVMHILVKNKTGASLWRNIWLPGPVIRSFVIRRLRPVENISARVLTHENNALTIHDLREVRPGDIIRSLNGNHVLLITEVVSAGRHRPQYLKYVNSTEYGDTQYGVREGTIVVKNPKGHILRQEWIDPEDEINLTYKAANDYPNDTRVVRLKLLQ